MQKSKNRKFKKNLYDVFLAKLTFMLHPILIYPECRALHGETYDRWVGGYWINDDLWFGWKNHNGDVLYNAGKMTDYRLIADL